MALIFVNFLGKCMTLTSLFGSERKARNKGQLQRKGECSRVRVGITCASGQEATCGVYRAMCSPDVGGRGQQNGG